MTDREKVIKALAYCVFPVSKGFPYQSHIADKGCEAVECPYRDDCDQMLLDALELLKEQEPRVLTPDEADAAEVVWFEARNHTHIEPMLTRGKKFADETADWFRYGRDWRCWSARPTDKQMEEEPWDA